MGEAFGDPKHLKLSIFRQRTKMKSRPLAEVRRVAPQIDRDVPDVAGEYADELSLRPAKLIVEATQNTACGERLVVLHKTGWETCSGEGLLTENFCKPAPAVAKNSRLEELDVLQRSLNNLHKASLAYRWTVNDVYTAPPVLRTADVVLQGFVSVIKD